MAGRTIRLGVNIDHVATLRNARGGEYPDPIEAALLAQKAGADGITAHLREDRRHIRDEDITRIAQRVALPLNLEMAPTREMQKIALMHRPHAVCIVPEKREERTTEGGLEVIAHKAYLADFIAPLKAGGARVSLFVAPVEGEIKAAAEIGADVIELHTGAYAEAHHRGDGQAYADECAKLRAMAAFGEGLGLEVHAGHGLNVANVGAVAAIGQICELNIGHFIISRALFVGLFEAISEIRVAISASEATSEGT